MRATFPKEAVPVKVLSDGSQEPITIEWVTRDTTD